MKVLTHPSVELWERVIAQSKYATFFHSPTWAAIITATYPHFRIDTQGFVLDDGAVAIVPIVSTVEQNRYFVWREAMYPGGYGGAVAERSLTPEEITAIFEHLPDARTAYLHVMGNPFSCQTLPPQYIDSPLYTHTLSLSEGGELIFDRYSTEKRRHVRKAAKLGVEVGIAETEADYQAYYAVYEDTLQRWGDSTLVHYPYRLFEEIYRRRQAGIRLWVARVQGEIVSGNVILYQNRSAVYWHGATRQSHFNYHPAPLLMDAIIQDACRQGYAYFDFGASGGLPGVEHYKEGFGAQKTPFHSYVWQNNRLYQVYQRLRGVLRRRPAEKDSAELLSRTADDLMVDSITSKKTED